LKTPVEFCFDNVYNTGDGEVAVSIRRFIKFMQHQAACRKEKGIKKEGIKT
jgi:hypothetical protein